MRTMILLLGWLMVAPQVLALEHQCPAQMVYFVPWEECIDRHECKNDKDCGAYSACDEAEGYCVPI